MPRSVSCTIMAYNEEATLEEATRDVVEALRAFGDRAFEVLIVDDGSTDGTNAIAQQMAARYPEVRVIRHARNRGPGSALVTGFAEARNQVICFHPADQQVRFAEVAALIPRLDEVEVVVARRSGRPGYTLARLVSSQVYIELVHLLFGLRHLKDFNFVHLYRKEIIDQIRLESDGVFMPTEILIKAQGLGARLEPAVVTCLPRRAGVASCGRPSVIGKTFVQMMSFWWRWQLGRLSGK